MSFFDVLIGLEEVKQIETGVMVNEVCFGSSFTDWLFGFRIWIVSADSYSCFIAVKSGIHKIGCITRANMNIMGKN